MLVSTKSLKQKKTKHEMGMENVVGNFLPYNQSLVAKRIDTPSPM